MGVTAVVAAGEGRASRAIHGESKAYLEIAGRPLVAHAVSVLQRVPEVSDVVVIGNAERLRGVLDAPDLRAELRKPLRVLEQHRNLLENAWESYRHTLPGAGDAGRDPRPEDLDRRMLYLSTDLPFATPQEISDFVRQGLEHDEDYLLGLVGEEAMVDFYPEDGTPGIRMAYFNLREGRVRQNNLHLVRPGRVGRREYIQEMYEHRYQKQFHHMLALAWRILWSRGGGIRVLLYYGLMHLAGVADRAGWRRLADLLRRGVSRARVERAVSALLGTRFRFVLTDVGGCAVDVDNEHDFDVARQRYDEWRAAQRGRAEKLHGPLPLPEAAGAPGDASS